MIYNILCLLPLLFVFLFAYASLPNDYKIIDINQTELTLTKGPFHIKTHVYMRDPLADMPWVDSKGNRPKDYFLTRALDVYKDKNYYFFLTLYTIDNEFIQKSDRIPDNFTGRADMTSIRNNIAYVFKTWFIEGKYHRIDGPAMEYANGENFWYIHGKQVTEQQHKLLVDMMKLKGLI